MSAVKLDLIFHALSDATRRRMLERLCQQELTVGELAQPFAMSVPAITKHLNVLHKAGLISKRRAGKFIFCRMEAPPLTSASLWIEKQKAYWQAQLDGFGKHLENEVKQRKQKRT